MVGSLTVVARLVEFFWNRGRRHNVGLHVFHRTKLKNLRGQVNGLDCWTSICLSPMFSATKIASYPNDIVKD
jgi:hypothetical protein